MGVAAAGWTGLGLMTAGNLVQGISAYNASNFNAKIMRRNAEMQEFRKEDAVKRLEKSEQQVMRNVARQVSQERVSAAAGNVAVGTGSTQLVEQDIMERGAEDITQLAENTRLELLGIEQQQQTFEMNAELQDRQAMSSLILTPLTTAGSALTASAQVSGANRRVAAARS